MSKKKNKKRNPQPALPNIRLSQCMIVKNEEKNIEKALGWAKNVAFEQIVVDTGSTDRTVEIAKKMGAKIFHFEWINDFAAAKNYAIEQAKGNWIAFLDADEFFTSEDTKKMMAYLKQLYAEPQLRDKYLAIICPWIQLDESGKPFGVNEQIRVFRNVPSIRYVGKIHESLSLEKENIVSSDKISIMHTGYSVTAYSETDKAERNIELLRKEQAERPDDLNIKVYLADSLRAKAREDGPEDGKVSDDEAEALYAEVAESDEVADVTLRKRAFVFTIEQSLINGTHVSQCEKLCSRALQYYPNDLDFEYSYARVLSRKGEYRKAWERFLKCEERLLEASALMDSDLIALRPRLLFREMIIVAEAMGDINSIVRYATMALVDSKDQQEVLGPLIATLIKHGTSDDEVTELLGKIYDLGSPKDLLLIAGSAKERGAIDYARKMAEMAKKLI